MPDIRGKKDLSRRNLTEYVPQGERTPKGNPGRDPHPSNGNT